MRWLLLKAMIVVVAAGLYVASPFVSAWNMREAIKNNDSAYLTERVDWVSVKETLKPSIASLMLPEPVEGEPRPGLWQRLKAYVGRGAVNRTIDSYMTPEGLPQLFQYGRTYREQVRGEIEEPAELTRLERAYRLWQRVKRADFVTLTRFEMTMSDKFDASKLVDATLELRGMTWTLTELRVRSEGGSLGRDALPDVGAATGSAKPLRFADTWSFARVLARQR